MKSLVQFILEEKTADFLVIVAKEGSATDKKLQNDYNERLFDADNHAYVLPSKEAWKIKNENIDDVSIFALPEKYKTVEKFLDDYMHDKINLQDLEKNMNDE